MRIATELQLHRAILKVADGDEKEYLRARIYYLVYVCDHHFSIAYGRPPLTGEYEAVKSTSRFLESAHTVEDDARLISQVIIWSTTSQVFETFGTDSSRPTPTSMISQVRRFNIALDTWRADWNDRFSRNNHVGNYPQKGVALHYYFAKLYLCSHAFRGISNSSTTFRMSQELVEIAEVALASATYILRAINTDSELQSYLNGLPLYFDTMIAFAAVFLLKISTEYLGIIQVDTAKTLSLVRQNVLILEEIGKKMKPEHILIRIGDGIRTLVERCRVAADQPSSEHKELDPVNADIKSTQANVVNFPVEDYMAWTQGGFAGLELECYDLLEPSTQNMYPISEQTWLADPAFQQNFLQPWNIVME